ncbi:response regulator transcription factor [Treponema maltophilum]|uniref:response regulator transcription factor n=1 Tax=Treponema maltophilum TaxID=51160 RepID=UPI003D8B87BE
MHVLIVEDDSGIADFLQLELEHEGFEVLHAEDGRRALELFENVAPDIILLDIMLPKLNGLEVLRRIRKTSRVPVIMLTARGDMLDKVSGLDSGADDYLAKPFEIEELLARMRAVMRRNEANDEPLKLRGIELNRDSMEVRVHKERIALSKTEYLLLKTFIENKNVVLSRDKIISAVWGENHYIDENSVDVYVRYLRSKIDDKTGEEYISTVRGAGYVMRDTSDEN